MDGWTEFDMVRIENELKEVRLYREAMMPKPEKARPIRTAMARTLMTLAKRLAVEPLPTNPSPTLVVGTSET